MPQLLGRGPDIPGAGFELAPAAKPAVKPAMLQAARTPPLVGPVAEFDAKPDALVVSNGGGCAMLT